MTKKKTEPRRLEMVLRGLGTFVAAIGSGVALLAAIGYLFPHHQRSPVLSTAIGVISLTMMAWAAMGLWLAVKGGFGGVRLLIKRALGRR